MKPTEFKVGDIVTFKGRGLGLGRIDSTVPQRKGKPLYHILLLSGNMLVLTSEEYIEKVEGEDEDLINALDSVGHM